MPLDHKTCREMTFEFPWVSRTPTTNFSATKSKQVSVCFSETLARTSRSRGITFPAAEQRAVRETEAQCLKVVKSYAPMSVPGPKSNNTNDDLCQQHV